jgi:glucose-1-phosphate thymidylyltransferase
MRKGILLAGGTGSRLYPLTIGVNKHLLPVYDKPMIFYPLSTLMLAGIRDILLITNEADQEQYKRLLKDGNQYGINIKYACQKNPEGVAQAFTIGKNFINNSPSALILGDNIFHGNQLIKQFSKISEKKLGATVLAYPVSDPERYGVVEFDDFGKVLNIEEKPRKPKSRYAITGLYFYDSTVVEKAAEIKKSPKGEFEITDINKKYLEDGSLEVIPMGRGMAWLDTGTKDSLYDASSYIKTLEQRQGFIIGCPEEIAWRKGWISNYELESTISELKDNYYKNYLLSLIS